MKTIQLPDDLYDQLSALATEIATQDNRSTAKPYLFQIKTDVKVWDTGLNGDTKVILSEDRDEVGEYSKATIHALAQEWEREEPDWIDDVDEGYASTYDVEEWLKDRGYLLTSYSIRHKLENGFLTASACQRHISQNHYHYDNPTDYLSHCFRNPEMELVFRFLKSLVAEKEEVIHDR